MSSPKLCEYNSFWSVLTSVIIVSLILVIISPLYNPDTYRGYSSFISRTTTPFIPNVFIAYSFNYSIFVVLIKVAPKLGL